MTLPIISFDDFKKIDIRVGTILSAELNPKARKPAYVLQIDFGEKVGVKTSSAQLTKHYQRQGLIGKQVCAVLNFAAMSIAGVKSEVLVLAAVGDDNVALLLHPSSAVKNGAGVA